MNQDLTLIELVHSVTVERGCFACGSDVMCGYEPDTGKEVCLCGRCGEVEYWVTNDQHGDPVQGFLPLAEAAKWTVPHPNEGKEIPF